jgi:hypothetical protein
MHKKILFEHLYRREELERTIKNTTIYKLKVEKKARFSYQY